MIRKIISKNSNTDRERTDGTVNGNESTPHLHMTFVPYSYNCSRGQKTQNALAQTFTRMGYKTTMEQARDASDELVWQDTPEGKKPQKKLDEEISAKNMTLEFKDALIEIKKSDVAEWKEKAPPCFF